MPAIRTMPRMDYSTLGESNNDTAYIVFDTESVPDGALLAQVKYPGAGYSPAKAIEVAQQEARDASQTGSDFLPVSFHLPVSLAVLRVAADFRLLSLTCLDQPHFRMEAIAKDFWRGLKLYPKAKLVTFHGRGFDLPLMEMAAYRFGISMGSYVQQSRNRFGSGGLDLHEWLGNFGASRIAGGLNLLAKIIGKPGKMTLRGEQVYSLYQEGRLQDINDYCLCDALDTYFVFVRTRVMTGEISLEREESLIDEAKNLLRIKTSEWPILQTYLAHWRN